MEKKGNNFRLTRRNLLQLLSLSLVVLFLMSFVENTTAQKPNFAGSWAYNQTKSDQPQGGGGGGGGRGFGGGGGTMNIKQDANTLTVDRVFTREGSDPMTMTEKFTFDGKESVNTMGQRGSSKSIAKWAADNKSLNIATTRTMQGQDGTPRESKSSAVWTLTDGGKTLTITTTSTGRDGTERVRKAVYDKK